MPIQQFFDVLNIQNNNKEADMIQSLMGSDCLGAYIKNGIVKLYFQDGLKNKVETRLMGIKTNSPFEWKWEKQNKEDWHLTWQENFQPVIFDEKLAVIPCWHDDSSADIVIKIKPGMAFGTGHHATTWLMLSQMIKYIKPGISVLDLGSGSGILSIAALKLGAEKIDAIENDPNCIINFSENLKLNNIAKGIQYYSENALNWNNLDYDLILANINRDVIEKLIPNLHNSKGTIILSGLLDTDYETLEQLCKKNNLQIKEKMIKEEWACIIILAH